jgi:hypothetical protein
MRRDRETGSVARFALPSITFRYTLARAVVVVEGATLGLFVTE